MNPEMLVDDDIDFDKYLVVGDEAKIRVAGYYAPQVMDNFHGHSADAGCGMPWDEGKEFVRLRPGKVSLWTGVTHHGKSTALSHAMVHAISQGEKVCMWSGEETPDVLLETMAVQAMCNPKPSHKMLAAYMAESSSSLCFYDHLGIVGARRLIGVMSYVAQERGITQFVIDSLMKTAVKSDDYDGQKDFVNQLAAFARMTGCHVHIVAHMRKGKDEAMGSIMDVKGAGDIINQVDNIFLIWKNKAKIEASAKAMPDVKLIDQPDTVCAVEKQRGRKSWTGKFNLTYHAREMQFTRRHGDPKQYFRGFASGEAPL